MNAEFDPTGFSPLAVNSLLSTSKPETLRESWQSLTTEATLGPRLGSSVLRQLDFPQFNRNNEIFDILRCVLFCPSALLGLSGAGSLLAVVLHIKGI